MPLARIILKASTGVPLHDRFTRFMKQRSSEEAALAKHAEPTPPVHRSSDKNRRLALDLERRHNDIESSAAQRTSRSEVNRGGMSSRLGNRSGDRSRSPVGNGRSKGWQSVGVKSRLGNGAATSNGSGVKDRLGKKSVKDRLDLPVQTISDRLGSKPMSERIELDKKPKIDYYDSPPKSRGNNTFNRNNNNFNNSGASNNNQTFRRGGPLPDQDTLDKEMDDYMKKSKHGLDSMLDDYMKAAPKNSSKAPQAAAATSAATETPTAETDKTA